MQRTLFKFRSALTTFLGPSHVKTWQASHKRTANIIEACTQSANIILYAKESNINPAFWGLNEPQMSRIRGSGSKWYIVLLKGDGEKGYFIDGTKLKGGLSMGGDDYKIHPNELSDWTPFNFYSDLFGVIMQRN